MPSIRTNNWLISSACVGLLAFGYYLQYVEQIEPCPLCIFQRVFFFGVGLVALLAGLHNPGQTGTRVYAVLMSILAIAGGTVAARQVWLQHLPPDQVPECGPGLSYMLEQLSVSDTLARVFKGSGECAEVTWTLLRLSIAEWALIAFVALTLIGIWQLSRSRVSQQA